MGNVVFDDSCIGKVLVCWYPTANYTGVRPRWERRRLRVHRVRRLSDEPLAPDTLLADPLLARSGILLTGIDLDKGRERSFYVGSLRHPRVIEEASNPNTAGHSFDSQLEPPPPGIAVTYTVLVTDAPFDADSVFQTTDASRALSVAQCLNAADRADPLGVHALVMVQKAMDHGS